MTFQELESALGENLDPAQWQQFIHRNGQPGGWFGEGAKVDPTVQMDPTAIVRGKKTEIGEFVVLGPDVQVDGGAVIFEGPVVTKGVWIDGPVSITGRRTEIVGPGVKIWWNVDPEERTDKNHATLVDVAIHGGSHVSGRVTLIQTEVDESIVAGPHESKEAHTHAAGSHILHGSTLRDGALLVNSDLIDSTASGFGTQVLESSLTNTVAPVGKQSKGLILGQSRSEETAALPSSGTRLVLLTPHSEGNVAKILPRRELSRHRHLFPMRSSIPRCQNRPTRLRGSSGEDRDYS